MGKYKLESKRQLKKVRIMLWDAYVKCQTGCENSYQIERYLFDGIYEFRQGNDNETRRPHIWESYEQGHHMPQNSRRAFVEERVKGSRYWLELPLWKLLDTAFQPTQQYLLDTIGRGSKQLKRHLKRDRRYLHRHIDLLWMRAKVSDIESVLAVIRYCEQELKFEHSYYKKQMLSVALFESKFCLVTMLLFLASREKHVEIILEELLNYVYSFIIKGSLPEISNIINAVTSLKCLSSWLPEFKTFLGRKFRPNDYYFYFWLFGSSKFNSYFWIFDLNPRHSKPEAVAKSVIELLVKYLPILEKKKHTRAFKLTTNCQNIEPLDLLGYDFGNLNFEL